MRKTLLIGFLFFALSLFSPPVVLAKKIAGQSATFTRRFEHPNLKEVISKKMLKTEIIRRVLDIYSSPLVDQSEIFVEIGFRYNIDCYLLPAIAGVESTFGHYLYPNSYNPFGWGGGSVIFPNWQAAIETVGQKLRTNYFDRGYTTIETIAPIYAQSPNWAQKVNYFIQVFQTEEEKINLHISKNQLELD